MATYNKYYETWIRGNDTVPATYGNVSLYTTGKCDLNRITTTNLAINKNNTANALDVSGNVAITGSLTLNGQAITPGGGAGQYVDLTTDQTVGGSKTMTGEYFQTVPSANNPYGLGTYFDKAGFTSTGTNMFFILDRNPTPFTNPPTERNITFTTLSSVQGSGIGDERKYMDITVQNLNYPYISRPIGTIYGQTKYLYTPIDPEDIVQKSYVDNNITSLRNNVDLSFNQLNTNKLDKTAFDLSFNQLNTNKLDASGTKTISGTTNITGTTSITGSTTLSNTYLNLSNSYLNIDFNSRFGVQTSNGGGYTVVPPSALYGLYDFNADLGTVQSQIDNCAPLATLYNDYYTKTEIDTNIYTKTQINTNNYTKTQTDASFALISSLSNYATNSSLNNYYTKTQTDNSFALISSLSNYATNSNLTTNYYTKTQTDASFALISSLSNYYTKTQVDFNFVPNSALTSYYTKTQTDASFVGLGNTQTITGVKTFSQPTTTPSQDNLFYMSFEPNYEYPVNFAATVVYSTSMVGNFTYNNWRIFSTSAGNRMAYFQYLTDLVMYVSVPQFWPPPWRFGMWFTSYPTTNPLYVDYVCNLPPGYYTLTFASYWGLDQPGGGKTSAKITVSVQTSSDTYVYSDPDTRTNLAWRYHTFKFKVAGTATYIRWTPSDTTTTVFNWAISQATLTKYNGQLFIAGSNEAVVGGELSVLNNATINNCLVKGSLSCVGIPNFNTSSGTNNLALNNSFGTAQNANNALNICIGLGNASGATSFVSNTIMGINNLATSNTMTNCVVLGSNLYGQRTNSTMIGYYHRHQTSAPGENVAVGAYIGATPTQDYSGLFRRSVAVGAYMMASASNPYSYILGAEDSVGIGWGALQYYADVGCVAVGFQALNSLIGTNGQANIVGGTGFITRYNTALGYRAGAGSLLNPPSAYKNIANNCIFIGANTDYTVNDISYSLALGDGASVGSSYCYSIGTGVSNNVPNSIRLGRSADLVKIDGTLNVVGSPSFNSQIQAYGGIYTRGVNNINGSDNGGGATICEFGNYSGSTRFRFCDEGGNINGLATFILTPGNGGQIIANASNAVIDIHTIYPGETPGSYNDAYAGSVYFHVGGNRDNGISVLGADPSFNFGNVGIRKQRPEYPLDVAGQTRIVGGLLLDGVNVGTKFTNIDASFNALPSTYQPIGSYMTTNTEQTITASKTFTSFQSLNRIYVPNIIGNYNPTTIGTLTPFPGTFY